MAKYENIRALAKKQLQAVTESSDRWKAFLRTAAIAYNYSFPNQLLIHEQSPTATAVADIAYWNNNAGRWVKRGAHGIAVFDTRANSSRLRYLFDISDTIPRAEIPEALPWVITDQNWRPVWDKIVADNHADSIQSALLMLSTSCVAQRSAMFTTALGKAIDGSSLQWAKPDEQRQLFIQKLKEIEQRVANGGSPAFEDISNKSQGNDNIRVTNTYGTKRINGYHLLENALNLRATKIYDTIYDENGKEQHKLNGPATEEAQAKQRMIEDAFKDWIFKDRERRESLVALYNEKFNCIRPREYDGSHIQFFGMNPEIALRPHQRNAIAHILYGHNTLLAHVVGAGKTYEMVAAAMEKKRLGLCSKTLVAVPNHLTGQFASEALKLYPNANILVTTQRDFEKSNRKRFCAKIATGNYDIVVIGHSQFEKIPLSDARKAEFIRKQIDELEMQLESMDNSDSRLTVKQLESKKKQLKTKLSNLLDAPKRDDVVTFEELGADSLMVDEAHNFKNLMTVTKMHNIAGISTTESQKASDLFMKCQYLDEITGARGVTFATGTPISNSMTELYTMQRYLQQYTLERNGLANFDSWAATFGETVTAVELAPEGTGYRTKTRFARFFNLPELMAMFKECADIQTADMLKLPVPALVGGKPTNIQLKPSETQKQMVAELGERADKIRNKMVKPYEDNMLKITNDGRKLALDQRLIDPDLPDDPDSKVNICVDKIFEIWEQTMPQRSAQLVFCDLSTPKAGVFNVYDDMKAKLIERGIPETEIAFIHEANTDARKTELFGKVRSGAVRVLMGSTAKMGAGTNVQKRLIALHHLDVPWRPSDIEQREGRILRQGNENKEVYVFRYVTEGTFDAYSWQLIENKQKFIGQIMTSKSPARSCDDMDEAALSYAEVKALAAGNPLIKEKMDLDVQLTRLKTLKAAHDSQRYELENKIAIGFPAEIRKCKEQIENATVDAATVKEHSVVDADGKDVFCIQLEKKVYYEKEPAGKALLGLLGLSLNNEKPVPIGYFKGMELQIQHLSFGNEYHARLVGSGTYSTQLGADVLGNLTRLSNLANAAIGRTVLPTMPTSPTPALRAWVWPVGFAPPPRGSIPTGLSHSTKTPTCFHTQIMI